MWLNAHTNKILCCAYIIFTQEMALKTLHRINIIYIQIHRHDEKKLYQYDFFKHMLVSMMYIRMEFRQNQNQNTPLHYFHYCKNNERIYIFFSNFSYILFVLICEKRSTIYNFSLLHNYLFIFYVFHIFSYLDASYNTLHDFVMFDPLAHIKNILFPKTGLCIWWSEMYVENRSLSNEHIRLTWLIKRTIIMVLSHVWFYSIHFFLFNIHVLTKWRKQCWRNMGTNLLIYVYLVLSQNTSWLLILLCFFRI